MVRPLFTIVTATAGAEKSDDCVKSWPSGDGHGWVVVSQGEGGSPFAGIGEEAISIEVNVPTYLGVVPAFKLGVDLALQITDPRGVIACLHDDVLIEQPHWIEIVMAFFEAQPECGLLGFGGGKGLGSDDIYKAPYNPYQLARQDFVSNMRDADQHGRRVTMPTRVACLDGFSQIGRVVYWSQFERPLDVLAEAGVIHHAYDAYLGAIANDKGWQVWMLPIACHHYGGQTAVGDAGYHQWADQQRPKIESFDPVPSGDQYLWMNAHKQVYDRLRGILPLRIT